MITCGRCTKDAKDPQLAFLAEEGGVVKHDTVADVRSCYSAPESRLAEAAASWYEAEARAELEAEARNERFWENRGADDGSAEWEARQGLVSYEEARLAAEGR